MDIMGAVNIITLFVALIVVDEILPPAFLSRAKKILHKSSKKYLVLLTAEKSYLSALHHVELLERRCIRELGVLFFHHEVVKRALVISVEIQATKPLTLKLLKEVTEEEEGLISSSQMVKGFAQFAEGLDDLDHDISSTKTLFQSIVPKAISEGWFDASFTKSSCEDGEAQNEDKKNEPSLEDLGLPEFNPIFLNKLINLTLDNKNKEKEITSVLLYGLHIEIFSTEDVVNGFAMLLESAEDTAFDILDAWTELALFLARVVIDDVLVPLNLDEIASKLTLNYSGSETVCMARSLITTYHASESILRFLGGRSGWAVEDAKDKITKLLDEYERGSVVVRSHRLERLLTGELKPLPVQIQSGDGTLKVNEDYEVFVEQDSALASWLLSIISDHILTQFVGAETDADVWSTVLKFFANRSTTIVMSLHCKLRSIKKGDESMISYLTHIKEVCDALAACGSAISDLEQVATILNGLPFDYQSFMAVITTRKKAFSFYGVKYVLVDADAQLKSFQLQTQVSMSANVACARSRARGRGCTRLQCQLCGKTGHSVDRCWHHFDQNFSAHKHESTVVDVNSCEVANGCSSCNNNLHPQVHMISPTSYRWVVDSGATHHVTPGASKVIDGSNYTGPGKLVVDNGQALNISKTGAVVLNTKSRALFLHNLLHVPSVTKNLLSVSKFARDNGVYFEYHVRKCLVKDEEIDDVLLQGQESGGLYQFDATVDDHYSGVNDLEANVVNKVSSDMKILYALCASPTMNPTRETVEHSNAVEQEITNQLPNGTSVTQSESHDMMQNTSDEVQSTTAPVAGHPMMTRSKYGIFRPKVYFMAHIEAENELSLTYEALQSPQWKTTVNEEYKALERNNIWSLVNLPKGRSIVGCKWIFQVKRNTDGSVQSPVVKASTINVMLALAVQNKWELRQVDVNNAFLNGELHEDVFIKQPQGFEKKSPDGSQLVCKLQKALYGLRQASRNWFAKLRNYVVENVVVLLSKKILLKDLGQLNFFLGIEVKHTGDSIFLSQKKHIMELLNKTRMDTTASTPTPMISSPKLFKESGDELNDAKEYRSLVLRYLRGTLDYGLVFSLNDELIQLTAFADADWGGNMGVRVQASAVIWYDNSSAIAMSENPVYHSKTKHVELDVHLIREKVAAMKLKVNYVPIEHHVVDGLTKALAKDRFVEFRQRLGVLSFERLIQQEE
ncbi:Tetratricopeptide repeat (TPR)-containing protein [Hibiscus syriacus]|uniref:Tetratricopeptide repeat (TPR)-containing protein n=1 Tax=Hibiscus syriacus TaxID=106335 RepID=A0A6A3D3D9_HIBSY|nr:Tetratricopeptide repeat (TPR)-containing protein [Hibiscus syriacus]